MSKIIKLLYDSLFLLFVLLFLLIGIFMTMGRIPDSEPVPGGRLSKFAKRELIESGIIFEDEKIQYYFSSDLVSFVDHGSLFTDIRVISYGEGLGNEGSYDLYSARYNEITDIKFIEPESLFESLPLIQIRTNEGLIFFLVLSISKNPNNAFYKKLVQVWKSNKETFEQEGDIQQDTRKDS